MLGLDTVLRACLLILLVVLGACSDQLSQEALSEHHKTWTEAEISDYSYDLVKSCYCEGSGKTISVVVEDGLVITANYSDWSDATESPRGMTVSEVFDLLRSSTSDDDVKVSASFSEDFSVPLDVSIKHKSAIDLDVLIELRNFSANGG